MTQQERETIREIVAGELAVPDLAHLLRQCEAEMRNLEDQAENYREAFRREQTKSGQLQEQLASALVTIRGLQGKQPHSSSS